MTDRAVKDLIVDHSELKIESNDNAIYACDKIMCKEELDLLGRIGNAHQFNLAHGIKSLDKSLEFSSFMSFYEQLLRSDMAMSERVNYLDSICADMEKYRNSELKESDLQQLALHLKEMYGNIDKYSEKNFTLLAKQQHRKKKIPSKSGFKILKQKLTAKWTKLHRLRPSSIDIFEPLAQNATDRNAKGDHFYKDIPCTYSYDMREALSCPNFDLTSVQTRCDEGVRNVQSEPQVIERSDSVTSLNKQNYESESEECQIPLSVKAVKDLKVIVYNPYIEDDDQLVHNRRWSGSNEDLIDENSKKYDEIKKDFLKKFVVNWQRQREPQAKPISESSSMPDSVWRNRIDEKSNLYMQLCTKFLADSQENHLNVCDSKPARTAPKVSEVNTENFVEQRCLLEQSLKFATVCKNHLVNTANIISDWARIVSADCEVQVHPQDKELRAALVHQASYALIGVGGTYLTKDAATGHFHLTVACKMELKLHEAYTFLRLSNLGYYYNKLCAYTDVNSPLSSVSNCGAALAVALCTELKQYRTAFQTMQNILYTQLRQGNVSMTLMSLTAWHMPHLMHLKWLNSVIEVCLAGRESQESILKALHPFVQHGNPMLAELAKYLLCEATRPMYKILINWLLFGDIRDCRNEFFIIDTSLGEESKEHLHFTNRYVLCEKRVPLFLNQELAQMIFAIGLHKSVEQHLFGEPAEELISIHTAEECLKDCGIGVVYQHDDKALYDYVNHYSRQTIGRVLKRCREELQFLRHLQILRKFLLLSDLRFVRSFILRLATFFNEAANNFYLPAINVVLQQTLHSCGVVPAEAELISSLAVEQDESRNFTLNSGWEVLVIVCNFKGPMNAVLAPAMFSYRALFGAIWQLHRVTYLLVDCILLEQRDFRSCVAHLDTNVQDMSPRAFAFIHQMVHVVSSLRSYFLNQVVDAAWGQLCERVKDASSYDELLAAHESYLSAIKEGLFFSQESANCRHGLMRIYKLVFRFRAWQQTFFETCLQRSKQDLQVSALAPSQFSTLGTFQFVCHSLDAELNCIRSCFEEAVIDFLLLLNRCNNFQLTLLFECIDFNDYYMKRSIQLHN